MMPDSIATDSEHFDFAAALRDCVACGIIVVSPQRHVIAFNDCAERQLGLTASEVLGKSTSILPPVLQSLLEETLASGQSITARDAELPATGRGKNEFQISTELAKQADAGVLSVLIELQDVGKAHEIATNLEHLDRLANLGVLGASIAHEIKNALVAVRTFVDLLHERHKDDELTDVVAREVLRIDAVVKQVLRDATRDEFTLAPLGLHDLINNSVNLLRHQFQARSIRLSLQLEAAPDRINGDDRQLRHALLNLLINALEAVNDGGGVSIATQPAGQNVRVTVADTGTGIRPEHLPRLFSPFFTTKREGTGLGLAITRRIVRAHGGNIGVQNTGAQGTAFDILLPLL